LTSDDIDFLLLAFSNTVLRSGVVPFTHLLEKFERAKNGGRRTRHQETLDGGLYLYICNTSEDEGTHWVIAGGVPNEGWLVIWDSLRKVTCVRNFLTKAREILGTEKVAIESVGRQRDGWRCGYYAVYWYLFFYEQVAQNVDIRTIQQNHLATLPNGWCEIVWDMLRLRDQVFFVYLPFFMCVFLHV
jgi:hypothetical protein